MTHEQIQEIKEKRLSGNYTLEEIGRQYGITRERVRQLVGVPNLRKKLVKVCRNCGNSFIVSGGNRELCKVQCKVPLKERSCIDCKELFIPRTVKQVIRCFLCWRKQRAKKQGEYNKRYQLKLKQLGAVRLNH
jgi:hypothetical protein